MIELNNLDYRYSKRGNAALSKINVSIPEGIHLLVGENGAGKTTLLHLLAGVSHPTVGECLINGKPADSGKSDEMGESFLLEENMYFPGRTIREFADRHSKFYPRFSPVKFAANLVAFGLSGDEPIKSLSLGNRKKTQLAYVLALGVNTLLLDEPMNALDIQSKETLRKLIATNLEKNQTIIVSTHTISELENLFDGAVMLTRSHLLFAGTEEAVSRKLAFEVGRMEDADAIYSEIQIGRVLNILPAIEDEPTKVDWRLLYSALHSPKRNEILKALTS